MISHRYKCVFIHIPKNGGASIERMIWKPEELTEDNLWMGFKTLHRNAYQTGALQHLYARNVRKAVGEKIYEEYFTFSMVRNPWDKVISQFLYLQKRSDLRSFLQVPRHVSFKKYLETITKRPHVHWNPQVRFVQDDNGEVMVDHIARFEDYQKEAEYILNKIGCIDAFNEDGHLRLPHVNKSSRGPYWEYYDDESKEMVADIYKEDIAFFDYSFDEEAYASRGARRSFETPKTWLDSAILGFKQRFK